MLIDNVRNEIKFAFSTGASVHQVCKTYDIGKTLAYELKNQVKGEWDKIVNKDLQSIFKSSKPKSMSVVGALGCTHFPYVREGYIDWVYDTFKSAGVTEVVHLGDLIDNHNWSRHATEPDAESGISEFARALEGVQYMRDKFKEWPVTWTVGNHDKIPARQLAVLGIPSIVLKTYEELWKVPEWDVCTSKVIDGVLYKHGIGTKSTLLTAMRLRQSFVSAHFHSIADTHTHVSHKDRVFGMHVGSGFDDKAVSARYAEESQSKSVISCGVIINGSRPNLYYMDL